eukprot:gene34491-41759_t
MEVGTEVWIRDFEGNEAWIAATVTRKETLDDSSKCSIVVRTDNNDDIKLVVTPDSDSDDIKLRNSFADSLVENLINLPYLHEPAILFCLQERYSTGDIYTYTGPILIALNPFKSLPLYSSETLE